jgi:hypothetical protein
MVTLMMTYCFLDRTHVVKWQLDTVVIFVEDDPMRCQQHMALAQLFLLSFQMLLGSILTCRHGN